MKFLYSSRTAACTAALLLSVWAQPLFAQSDEQRSAARELATEGATAFNAEQYREAVEYFTKAESLVHAPPHLMFLARSHVKLGQFVKAREAYLKVIKEQLPANAPQAFRDAQSTASGELAQIEPKIGKLAIRVDMPEGVKDLVVTLDGAQIPNVVLGVPQPADPGEHVVEAKAPGYMSEPQKVTLAEAERGAVTVKLEVDPNAPKEAAAAAPGDAGATPGTDSNASATQDKGVDQAQGGSKVPAYVAFGVGAVGLGLGTVFLLQWSGKNSEEDDICNLPGGACPLDKKSEVEALDSGEKTASIISIAGFGLGAAGIVTGIVLLASSGGSDSKSGAATKTHIRPWASLNSAGVAGRF